MAAEKILIGCGCLIGLMLMGFGLAASGAAAETREAGAFLTARRQMVEQQIRRRGIANPRILAAFMKVARHRFVPEACVPQAYEDRPLPIGEGQTISQPYIVAFMTDVLDLAATDRVLEVGTGSGYQAAILAELCGQVYTIEIVPALGQKAKALLKELGYANVKVRIGDGYQGWEAQAPFDAIIVTCSPSHVPEPLKRQLKDGGRMIIPVGEAYEQKLVLLRKTGTELKEESVLPVRFVPMVDTGGKRY